LSVAQIEVEEEEIFLLPLMKIITKIITRNK